MDFPLRFTMLLAVFAAVSHNSDHRVQAARLMDVLRMLQVTISRSTNIMVS
jgi:hypothetical protein